MHRLDSIPNLASIPPASRPPPAGAPLSARPVVPATPGEAPGAGHGRDARSGGPGEQRLSPGELRQLEHLKARDREVRGHEAAHRNAAAGLARGAVSYVYQTGPDGRRYAVGGEVDIDTRPVPGDPEATLRKAETIRRAATAPAEPSSQDRAVAAQAARMAAEARAELQREAHTQGPYATAAAAYRAGSDTPDVGSLLDVQA